MNNKYVVIVLFIGVVWVELTLIPILIFQFNWKYLLWFVGNTVLVMIGYLRVHYKLWDENK